MENKEQELKINYYALSDNIEFIKLLPPNSIDAIITDSPYGLGKEPNAKNCIYDWVFKGYHEVKGTGFMGKKWDAFVPQPILWKECYRVLKPGGHLLSFFGTRTYDWGTMAIRLAGFEIRDCIQWIYGSGFPKSKACLKPANEPICVARKPGKLVELNIEECRVPMAEGDHKGGLANRSTEISKIKGRNVYGAANKSLHDDTVGRYPSNVIIDDHIADQLDKEIGCLNNSVRVQGSTRSKNPDGIYHTMGAMKAIPKFSYNDFGGPSRFFYVAKASPSERKEMKHPTIKPVKLMEQLVKLYCPPGGVVLDPHFGSGPTGEACLYTGRKFLGCDNDPDAIADANIRFKRYGEDKK